MNINLLFSKKTFFVLFASFVILCAGCTSNQPKSSKSDVSDDSVSEIEDLTSKIDTVKKIFYSMPSPVEITMLIANAGATYDPGLMNPVSNAINYNTNLKLALNLGIYSTDLSYASLYEQSQAILDYINAAKRMADGLSITDAIDDEVINKLEENINDKNEIIDIISETLLNSNSFLEDKGLQATASVVFVGGWIEGLYIASNLVPSDADVKSNKLVERIAEQKITLDIVVNLLKNNSDNNDVQIILKDIEELKQIYNKIKITQPQNKPSIDPNTNITLLDSEVTIKMTTEIFKELTNKIKEIRTRYVS